MAGSGTMVSAAVLSALPVELPPRLLEMLLVTALACALAFSELVRGGRGLRGRDRRVGRHAAHRAALASASAAVPLALPAAVLK